MFNAPDGERRGQFVTRMVPRLTKGWDITDQIDGGNQDDCPKRIFSGYPDRYRHDGGKKSRRIGPGDILPAASHRRQRDGHAEEAADAVCPRSRAAMAGHLCGIRNPESQRPYKARVDMRLLLSPQCQDKERPILEQANDDGYNSKQVFLRKQFYHAPGVALTQPLSPCCQ